MDITAEIARRMRSLGLSPERLSVAAGLGKTYVRDILQGRAANPRLDKLTKLARALGCTVYELTGQPQPDPGNQPMQTDPELLRQAFAVASRITAEEDPNTRDEATPAIAAAVYDVLIERSRSGKPFDEDILAAIEAMIRRMRRV